MIIKIYNLNLPHDKRDVIWNWCYNEQKKVPINRVNLENMANNELIFGFFGRSDNRDDYPEVISKSLYTLAVALGIRGLQNPEGGCNPVPVINKQPIGHSELYAEIEKVLGFKVPLPEFTGGRKIFKIDQGIITTRIINYIWVLKRITELCPARNSRIIEIGAGLGILGFFLDRLGYKDYTIIDLANANACQTYFLARNLPDRELILSTQKLNPFKACYKNAIKILHARDFDYVDDSRFDLMVNMDGLSEMFQSDAEMYVKSKCAPMLLSINHEMNSFRVCEIYKPEKKLVYRYPFWTRDGYVEELYAENL